MCIEKMDLSRVKTVGNGLARPEGVMAAADGTIVAADARGCCARITPDGKTGFYGDVGGVPNGICLDEQGNCIIANIGNGQVQCLALDGTHRVLFTEADGRIMPTPNFPFMDMQGRLWVSNSTAGDLEGALRKPAPDGCVVLYEQNTARIVAEGLYFANGVAVDESGSYLYVAETTRRAVTRFVINRDGGLGQPESYGPVPLGDLGFPDGIALDESGNLWVTFPAWGAIGVIAPDRQLYIVLEDRRMEVLRRPTNICFGGKDRRTAFIGSLDGRAIPCFQVPSPGQALIHQV
ncbi:MAG: SMP-30/gluconolactonase/LRE family protein [Desulfobacterales bacterium]